MTIEIPYSSAQTVTINLLIRHQKEKSKVGITSNKHPTQSKSIPKPNADTSLIDSSLCCNRQTELFVNWNPFGSVTKNHWLSKKKSPTFWGEDLWTWKADPRYSNSSVFFKQKSTTKSNICTDCALLSTYQRNLETKMKYEKSPQPLKIKVYISWNTVIKNLDKTHLIQQVDNAGKQKSIVKFIKGCFKETVYKKQIEKQKKITVE